MSKVSWKFLYSAVQKVSWALFLVCLPVTSFPFFPAVLGGGALVRPLSLYLLIILFPLVTLPRFLGKPLPGTLRALLPFGLAALVSSLLALMRGIEPTLGVSVADRLVRAWLTLGIGVAIYLTVSLLPRTPDELRAALRWLYAGFSLALLWGSVQAVYVIHFVPWYFRWANKLQTFVSTRRLFNNRVSGPTYEPNWFAGQISFLLLPWLLASVLSGQTVFPWRRRWLTVEWLLLAWSVAILALTFSRAGLMIMMVLAFIGLVFFRRPRAGVKEKSRRFLKGWTLRLVEAGLVVLILIALIFFAGSNNAFFSRIWGYWSEIKNTSLSGYFNYIGFGARFIYANTALRTYDAYPVFGVGLGTYAFYFEKMLPDIPLAETPEVLRVITPDTGRDRLITTKNLYLRLLAETGLVGTAAFAAFIVAVLGCALYLWFAPHPEQKFWGTAGLLGLIAFIPAALSFDSFSIPNMWVVFGMITSAAWVYAKPQNKAGVS